MAKKYDPFLTYYIFFLSKTKEMEAYNMQLNVS